jgi:hypothetical protein
LDFAMVLEELAGFLSRIGVRHAIAGAVALHAHVLTRATMDLDLVVEEGGRDALLAHMAALGYEQLHASPGFSNHLHPERAGVVWTSSTSTRTRRTFSSRRAPDEDLPGHDAARATP